MENMIKEKEQGAKITVVLLEALPITAIPTTTSSTTSTGDAADQLANEVQNMSLQNE